MCSRVWDFSYRSLGINHMVQLGYSGGDFNDMKSPSQQRTVKL